MKKMPVSEAKAKLSATVDKVCATGETIVLTKHGKPVATIAPFKRNPESLFDSMKGIIEIRGDLVTPANDLDDWEVMR